MTGDLNMPYEDVPDGPFELDVEMILCGGALARSAVLPLPTGSKLPGLVFDFYTAEGERLAPIALFVTPEEMLAWADTVASAARSAVREARR